MSTHKTCLNCIPDLKELEISAEEPIENIKKNLEEMLKELNEENKDLETFIEEFKTFLHENKIVTKKVIRAKNIVDEIIRIQQNF